MPWTLTRSSFFASIRRRVLERGTTLTIRGESTLSKSVHTEPASGMPAENQTARELRFLQTIRSGALTLAGEEIIIELLLLEMIVIGVDATLCEWKRIYPCSTTNPVHRRFGAVATTASAHFDTFLTEDIQTNPPRPVQHTTLEPAPCWEQLEEDGGSDTAAPFPQLLGHL